MDDCDAVHDASDVKEIKYLMEMFDISFMYWLDYKKGEKWLR